MAKINIKTTSQVEPKCYAYTTPEIKRHDGWTKIGYTEQDDVIKRIQQQTQTADIKFNLEWAERAVYEDGKAFRDSDFHTYLTKKEIERKENTEWFKIEPDKSYDEFKYFRKHRGVLETMGGTISYKLRKEQAEAVQKAQLYFNANQEYMPEFLWNAKPRFGKTLSAYQLCKDLNAKKILIVTNRPAIANSWYDDYVRFLGTESGYYFLSQVDALKGKPYVISREQLPSNAKGYIEFLSLQDMKGSTKFGGKIKKLTLEAQIEWDILIIDEAHEGVDTFKTDMAFDSVNRKYTLHLSGTPFKALANNKFPEQAIYNWTYADEQKAKRDWDASSEEENPYETLPTLNLYTYQMSSIIEDELRQGQDFNNDGQNENYAFDLNEFFETDAKGEFKHDASVNSFLDALVNQAKFPFSTPELRNEIKHSFWLLNRVNSARALARKLQAHPIFSQYKIILAAGDGDIDDFAKTKKSFDEVRDAIAHNDKTITLSVGQLTTGVTIPEWTAVLMLSNVKSPALYMQAAFRAQNPYLFNSQEGFCRKANAFVFDFDPARTLTIFEQFANDLISDTTNGRGSVEDRKKHVRELINFFPVYGEDNDGEMIPLDAEKVLSIPRKIHAQEVVKRGFMSNFLFQNIGNVFHALPEELEIIKKLNKDTGDFKITENTKDDLCINEAGDVELPPEMVVGKANEIFGPKMYNDLAEDFENAIGDLTSGGTKENPLAEIRAKFKENVTDPLIAKTKDEYKNTISKSTQQTIARKIEAAANEVLEKQCGKYNIQKNEIEADRKEEIQNATTAKQEEQINQKYDLLLDDAMNTLKQNIETIEVALVQKSAEIAVEAVETENKEKDKNEKEDEVKVYLRGFARSIPSFLMAYGTEDTTLENFDNIIPDNVFKEVTGITPDEFRIIKKYFDPIVFNDSVQEFLNLKEKLADYFDETHTEDIFDYIPPQKTNQIFTPKKVVKEMVQNLEEECPECFNDPNKTFIDLYMKSGLYITEIVKKLYNSPALKRAYPKETDRLNHIFEHQVYGLAPTEIIYRIALSYILGFADKKQIKKHNLRYFDTLPSVQNGTLESDLDKLYEGEIPSKDKVENKNILKRIFGGK